MGPRAALHRQRAARAAPKVYSGKWPESPAIPGRTTGSPHLGTTVQPVRARAFDYPPRMTLSLTDTLCTRCGLCCDGTLFADVELAGRSEATSLEAMGVELEDDGSGDEVLVQPCRALLGTRCAIYAHRPKCCRSFECRLLQDVRRGDVSVERAGQHITSALEQVARVRQLIGQLGQDDERLPLKERCAEALAIEDAASPQVNLKRAELEQAMSALDRSIRNTFLGRSKQRNGKRA